MKKIERFELLQEVKQKLKESKRGIEVIGYPKDRFAKEKMFRKKLYACHYTAGLGMLRISSEDVVKAEPIYSSRFIGYRELSYYRNAGITIRTAKILKNIDMLFELDYEKVEKVFAKYFYALTVVYRKKIYFYNFVDKTCKKLNNDDCATIYGFYYNPIMSEKSLEYFERGFIETYTTSCHRCGARHCNAFEEHPLTEVDGNYYCNNCLSDLNYGTCEKCGKKHFRKEVKITEDNKLVRKALHLKNNQNIYYICEDCLRDKVRYCSSCSLYHIVKDFSENGVCKVCSESRIESYGYKPMPIFKRAENEMTKLHFGIELEIESRDRNIRKLARIVNTKMEKLCYCKHDATIMSGFEIVSHPMSYKYMLEKKGMIKRTFDRLIELGGHSFDASNTGLHIHISRSAFEGNVAHLKRFCQLFYMDRSLVENVALRNCNQWCIFDEDRGKMSWWNSRIGSDFSYRNTHSDRYYVTNLENTNTVEIRCFKGNLKYESLLMYVQFVNSAFDYSKNHEEMSVDGFVEYIESLGKQYRLLKKRVRRYSLMKQIMGIENEFKFGGAICA